MEFIILFHVLFRYFPLNLYRYILQKKHFILLYRKNVFLCLPNLGEFMVQFKTICATVQFFV